MTIETRMRVVCDRCAAVVEWWEPEIAAPTLPDGWREHVYGGGWCAPDHVCPECVAKDEPGRPRQSTPTPNDRSE